MKELFRLTAREVVSLPCYPELRDDEIATVIRSVHEACRRAGP
jgi:dTDP-4-amino-4,6-dideoxygalactose transaminase